MPRYNVLAVVTQEGSNYQQPSSLLTRQGHHVKLRSSLQMQQITVISRLALPFWYRLTRIVPEKGPLSVCVCACRRAEAGDWLRADQSAAVNFQRRHRNWRFV